MSIRATEWCQNIKKEELTEIDIDGAPAWMSTEAAAQKLTAACADLAYDELYIEMKVGELNAAGLSDDEAFVQAMMKLADAGLGDVD